MSESTRGTVKFIAKSGDIPRLVDLIPHFTEVGLVVATDELGSPDAFNARDGAVALTVLVISPDDFGFDDADMFHAHLSQLRDQSSAVLVALIGHQVLGHRLRSATFGLPKVRASSIEALLDLPEFSVLPEACTMSRGDAGSFEASYRQVLKSQEILTTQQKVERWYRSNPDLKAQCLAVAVGILEGDPLERILTAASELELLIEGRLRAMTEFEVEQTPRGIGEVSNNARLAQIKAKTSQTRKLADARRHESAHFDDASMADALLLHVWQQREDLKDAWLAWAEKSQTSQQLEPIGVASAHALGGIAQTQLDGVLTQVVVPWIDRAKSSDARRNALDVVLASALENKELERPISLELDAVLKSGMSRDRDQVRAGLATGQTGLRRPNVAALLAKRIQPSDPVIAGFDRGPAVLGVPDEPARISEREIRANARATHEFDRHLINPNAPSQWMRFAYFAMLGRWIKTLPLTIEGARGLAVPLDYLCTGMKGLPVSPPHSTNALTLSRFMFTWANMRPVDFSEVMSGLCYAGAMRTARDEHGGSTSPSRQIADMFAQLARRRTRETLEREEFGEPQILAEADALLHFVAGFRAAAKLSPGHPRVDPLRACGRSLTSGDKVVIAKLEEYYASIFGADA